MNNELVAGRQYLLDGKIVVVILKPVNRSKTIYSVELPGPSIMAVERNRLQEIQQS
ncbi:hypothetical protein [Ohtaekwangia koreensis]|jgi:hypothetical protein|uniref:Uncharacterized protein n=1 Tax=Ohtaekwangia koreensis TaxID=688867 RepID=A0A1T5M7E8_9BACT|nr:hypothetical protein [Ohtaekwangia koreensis]SKC84161.1 hypothetical protein SAMN05660236_4690 [Ohtaekwangia koreensis]